MCPIDIVHELWMAGHTAALGYLARAVSALDQGRWAGALQYARTSIGRSLGQTSGRAAGTIGLVVSNIAVAVS
jgi:hypothetical protein